LIFYIEATRHRKTDWKLDVSLLFFTWFIPAVSIVFPTALPGITYEEIGTMPDIYPSFNFFLFQGLDGVG